MGMAMLCLLLFNTACEKVDDGDKELPADSLEVVDVSGTLSSTTTWKADKKYLLKGFVYVAAGSTLNIEAGTIIKGDKDTKGSLIILPGAKIMAEGTPQKPIVFTSNQPKGARGYGDWGGLILLGKAGVNKSPATIEGENLSTFGGTDDNDNSGVLKYVRIEFAGVAFEPDKEINGLTLGGVGRGTTIEYVQVSYSGDDSFEWFGGTVNAKHLIAFRGLDDDFDTDNGYSGNVQFGLSLRDPNIADQCTCSSSNGFESDNDGSGTAATPQTNAHFANMSLFVAPGSVNAKYNNGALIRRNSALSLYNSVWVGEYPKAGLELNGTASQDNFINNAISLKGLVLSGMTKPILSADSIRFYATENNNQVLGLSELQLDGSYNTLNAPKLLPLLGSPLLKNAATLPSGFEAANYRGAFDTEDWTTTWANFDPQNVIY
ncbi:MAG: T9SS C-terminal target domain-containing protein [Sphingobacteriales bacterium]|nr:T9SS C-terminal target domain-containing protein [Sphingobacteriales bacterium]MBK7527438.1 T9SS C-terminal target domain-containing protein [Sphingobacteriales bacterium]MBK8678212.1 T9SS C-terminal target domain-containing protein [Sphingobacteriales bacterium]MBL0248903.1 T9SS C-terminal target domain-containing protein [Sphingobacteriales bacterium]